MPLRSLKWVFWAALAMAPAASAVMPLDPGDMIGHPHYRVGQPYKIGGVWYYPKEDWSYDETGIASWYGKPFQGRHTADGETFNLKALTAAHRTLPMPVVVRVTNLDNGRSVKLRVNDRGPFVATDHRIIDVSRHAARVLGFEHNGLAPVRVQIDVPASLKAAKAASRGTIFGLHIPWSTISWSAIALPSLGLPAPAMVALLSALLGALGFWLLVLDDDRAHRSAILARRAESPVQPSLQERLERAKLRG